jgi:flagellar biosynthetic protein FliQ
MTLSFIPKLLVLALVVALTGPWMLHTMVEYTRELIMSIPQLVN